MIYMGLVTNAGVMKFAVNGAERMRINNNGSINIPVNNYLRIEGSSTNNNTKALSIGGYGVVEVDAVGTGGGRFSIDNSGNVSCKGNFTNGSNNYIFAGGLRIGGFDGNTLYNDTRVLGLTALNNIIFNTGHHWQIIQQDG